MTDRNGAGFSEMLRTLLKNDSTIDGPLRTIQLANIAESQLDPRTHALVRIAALATLGASPVSYAWQVQFAEESGVAPEEMLGVLVALTPTIGMVRVVSAAAEIAYAMGLEEDLPDD